MGCSTALKWVLDLPGFAVVPERAVRVGGIGCVIVPERTALFFVVLEGGFMGIVCIVKQQLPMVELRYLAWVTDYVIMHVSSTWKERGCFLICVGR